MSSIRIAVGVLAVVLLSLCGSSAGAAGPRPHRLPSVDLQKPVIWGSECLLPDGIGLAFGGQDQTAADGQPHTRIREEGKWRPIHEELRSADPAQAFSDRCRRTAKAQKDLSATTRAVFFRGLPAADEARAVSALLLPRYGKLLAEIDALKAGPGATVGDIKGESARHIADTLAEAVEQSSRATASLRSGELAAAARQMLAVQISLEKAAEATDAEPPPRALSPIAYDPATRRFVLFGGDHLDYLTNDVWVFDPAVKRWQARYAASSPVPRADHRWKAAGDGKFVLEGGYTYTSSNDYCGGQYGDLDDGDWTYDMRNNTWTGAGRTCAAGSRVYRTGPFHPDFFLTDPKPDAAVFQAWLKGLPANTWVQTKPPQLPQLNRDWGTAVLDTDRDMILRFSGGHSAHGGSDVLHYHLAANRWELPFPVEFPLGQLYSNTSYPEGFNFNMRPWVTGHTYQSYGYDATAQHMVFTGQPRHAYLYGPDVADWIGRSAKPREMSYDSCYYTLTLCPTPKGMVCWTQEGRLFRFDAAKTQWEPLKLTGPRLPGSVVDNSTLAYDRRRDRLIFARKPYGDQHRYDGQLHVVDLKSLEVGTLSPQGMAGATAVPYLCQIRYDTEHDLLLVGATLPPGNDGSRRTPAYDCAANRWLSLKLAGDDPSGKQGRNVSLGLVYDAPRRLFWAVDTRSRVYVLRLEPKTAGIEAM